MIGAVLALLVAAGVGYGVGYFYGYGHGARFEAALRALAEQPVTAHPDHKRGVGPGLDGGPVAGCHDE